MTTDRTVLPDWNGRPVPWVTRWTGEVSKERFAITVGKDGRFTYKDGNDQRDKHDVLWQREGVGRQGEPDWASVSTYRQRRCMTHRLCQVCGIKIEDGPIHWLMPMSDNSIETLPNGDEVTINPPTCEDCIPLALELCPHLKANGYMILKVLDYEVWGVSGEVVAMDNEGQPHRFQGAVPYDEKDSYAPALTLDMVLAQQQAVKLGKYVIEETVPGLRSRRPPESALQELRNAIRNSLLLSGMSEEEADKQLDDAMSGLLDGVE